MSHRLQVILDEEELRALQAAALRHRSTVSDYVRRVLLEAVSDAFPTAGNEDAETRIRAGGEFTLVRTLVREGLDSGPSEPFPGDYFEELRDRLAEG